jgi:DNA-binding transcriptional MerR regulator
MRIAELSRRTGVSVPTIKYYLREGLLPAGESTGPNQARYDETHVRRLRLIRALVTVGGVSIASVGAVLDAIDTPDLPIHHRLGFVQHSVTRETVPDADEERWAAASKLVDELIAQRGWHTDRLGAAGQRLVSVLVAMDRLGQAFSQTTLDTYADAVEKMAVADLDYIAGSTHPDDLVVGMVIGTVLGEEVLNSMRRMAHENESYRRYGERPDL